MITPHIYPIQTRLGETPLSVHPVFPSGPPTPIQLSQVYKQVLLARPETQTPPEEVEESQTSQLQRRRTWRTVADVMRREVLTVPTTMTVRDLAQFLSHHRISGVPVVDPEGKLVGVISLSDVNSYAAHSWARIPPADQRSPQAFHESTALSMAIERLDSSVEVGKIMSPYIYYATEDSDLLELADLMVEQHIHRLMVLDENDQLTGIVTSLDLVKAMRQELSSGR